MKPGERVAMLRTLRGLSQLELGRRVGLSQSILSRLEACARKLEGDEAVRLARNLQCSLEDLLGSSGSITITFHNAGPPPTPVAADTPAADAAPRAGMDPAAGVDP